MDGNRRWAKQKGKFAWQGHKAGMKAVERTIDFCLKQNISYVSLYTFSLENLKRSEEEKSYMFDILLEGAIKYASDLKQKGVRVKFIGDITKFPEKILQACKNLEEETAAGRVLQCNLLFCYGGRQEIVHAAKQIALECKDNVNIDSDLFEKKLWTSSMPDPDLIVRTGGMQRLSNFLLYQGAYAEIRFSKTLWPDFTEQELLEHVTSAYEAHKNYGC